jgi:uncharacterized protein (DUF1697 family)
MANTPATFIALLRGINVGGKNIIPMEDLREAFAFLEFLDVKTYIQSGNVVFTPKTGTKASLKKKIEKMISERYGLKVPVILRSETEIKKMVKANPFGKLTEDRKIKLYVCFLDALPVVEVTMPVILDNEGLELISMKGQDAFVVSRPINGSYGFPNNIIEKKLKVTSTARNWNTVMKIAEDLGK